MNQKSLEKKEEKQYGRNDDINDADNT